MTVKTSQENKQKIMNLLDQGLSERKIALRFHCCRETVAKVRRERKNEENIINVKQELQLTIDLKIQITPRPEGYLVELDYGKPKFPEPFNATEMEAIDKVTKIVDDALKRKKIYATQKRDFRYRNVNFPSQFFVVK